MCTRTYFWHLYIYTYVQQVRYTYNIYTCVYGVPDMKRRDIPTGSYTFFIYVYCLSFKVQSKFFGGSRKKFTRLYFLVLDYFQQTVTSFFFFFSISSTITTTENVNKVLLEHFHDFKWQADNRTLLSNRKICFYFPVSFTILYAPTQKQTQTIQEWRALTRWWTYPFLVCAVVESKR